MADSLPEPWLRGPIEGVPPHLMPVFHSFAMVREDLARYTEGLAADDVWRRTGSLPSLGFHLRHIAHSVDRLVTYLCGDQLSEAQIATLKREAEPGATLAELLEDIDEKLSDAERRIRTIQPGMLNEPRYIGKKRLPSTVLGLLVHVAEHTQRHLGQAITTAKLAPGNALALFSFSGSAACAKTAPPSARRTPLRSSASVRAGALWANPAPDSHCAAVPHTRWLDSGPAWAGYGRAWTATRPCYAALPVPTPRAAPPDTAATPPRTRPAETDTATRAEQCEMPAKGPP